MTVQMTDALATLAAAMIFVLIFYGESWWQWLKPGRRRSRRVVSFSAGMAVAYVFVHLLPALAAATEQFVAVTAGRALPYPQLRVYTAALVGFTLFYGLEHLVHWSRLTTSRQTDGPPSYQVRFRLLAGSYAFYVMVVCYLMAHEIEVGGGRLALYAVAMGLHFLGLAYGLCRDYEPLYDNWGRHTLAGAAILGWAIAVLVPLPDDVAYTLLGFVAGAVIMNTVTMELPGRKEGRFFAFFFGGAVYTGILVLIGR